MYSEITRSIKVSVKPFYLEDQSSPAEGRYVWAYHVRIENRGLETVQLRNRHWQITDNPGQMQEVRGTGVVGEQPVLAPGEAFEYTSFCPLNTPGGTMHGTYRMVYQNGAGFDAIIAPFGQHTSLSVNASGYLASIANPAGESFTSTYGGTGLLSSFTDPTSNTTTFQYDSLGRLVSDSDAVGGVAHLITTREDSVAEVVYRSAVGLASTYRLDRTTAGLLRRVFTDAAGIATTTVTEASERTITRAQTGDTTWVATGLLSAVIFAALGLALLEYHPKADDLTRRRGKLQVASR